MAVVQWTAAIEFVKGALKKPKKKAGHSHGTYLIGTHREAATSNPHCNRAYTREAEDYKRTTPVTADELALRARFAAVSRQVAIRAKNLSTIAEDTQAFKAQKDQPGGAKTFKAYLWRILGAVYDENQG